MTHPSNIFRQDRGLIISGVLCNIVGYLGILIVHWDFLPHWVPIPYPLSVPEYLENLFFLGFLCFPFLYLGSILATALLALQRVLVRSLQRRFRHVLIPAVILGCVSFLILTFVGTTRVERILLNYGLGQYDKVIEAIEQYKADNNIYPQTLDELVPNYLHSKPGIVFKYGERLDYVSVIEEDSRVPFKFELYGHGSRDVWGRVLKYCPVKFNCPFGSRINDRWMWTSPRAF